jgi:8-oxo-dGTP pyrophosphatase MutT (NUDIX family)
MKREHIIQCLEPAVSLECWSHQKRDDGLRNAAVLIPLVERDEWQVLLTKRTDHLNHHAGQVSFPGGRADAVDVSPLHTALRETEEEVGIQPELIEIIGVIEPFLTVTDFNVVPVVGFVQPSFTLDIDEFEVADVFEVPLSILADQSRYQKREILWQGEKRAYWELMHNGFQIWGATAAMLYAFAGRLNATRQG